MANIAIFRINYKSDFILTLNSDAGWMTPFCIKFWTGAPSQAYFVGFDGTTYTHCAPVAGEPTKLRVQFDDHHLPIGDLKFQIGYHFTIADFPTSVEDEVINQASIIIEVDDAPAQVMLDFNGETAPEIEFSLPAYANEAQRIANEQQRIANETQRIANEETRIQHEESRIAAEQTRQRNEQQRINQEQARVEEYAGLKADAVAATGAANDAAALANQKAQLAADKAALAGAAATLANAKAQLAADKAALAESAATLANQKAALAQQKAEYAQEQGTYSKNQGDYAKEQGDYSKAKGDYAKDQGDYAKRKGDDAAAQMQQQAQAFIEAQAARQVAYEQSEGTESGSVAGDGSRWGAFKTNEAARDAKVDAKVADITNLQEAVAEGAVYDVSAKNPTAGPNNDGKWGSLSALLSDANLNTLIPSAVRRGGMSIKFVLSSDNKYVSYFYKGTSTDDADFTNVANWQGVDDSVEPKNNLVTGNSVSKAFSDFCALPMTDIPVYATANGWKLSGKGLCSSDENFQIVKYQVVAGDVLKITASKDSEYVLQFQNGASVPAREPSNLIGEVVTVAINGVVKVPASADYLIVSKLLNSDAPSVKKVYNSIDDTPTAGSKNLVESGGVASHIVYDISEANNGVAYASLRAALGTNGANVPESIRKGGMSVKFVMSYGSNNSTKYVQYMYNGTSTANDDFIKADNWEKINLEDEVNELSKEVNGQNIQITQADVTSEAGLWKDDDGVIGTGTSGVLHRAAAINLTGYTTFSLTVYMSWSSTNAAYLCDDSGNIIETIPRLASPADPTVITNKSIPEGATKLYVNFASAFTFVVVSPSLEEKINRAMDVVVEEAVEASTNVANDAIKEYQENYGAREVDDNTTPMDLEESDFELGNINGQTGAEIPATNVIRSGFYEVVPGAGFTFSTSNNYAANIFLFNAQEQYIGGYGWQTGTYTDTFYDLSAVLIRIVIASPSGVTTAPVWEDAAFSLTISKVYKPARAAAKSEVQIALSNYFNIELPILAPSPQLPANTDTLSDINAETMTSASIQNVFETLIGKLPVANKYYYPNNPRYGTVYGTVGTDSSGQYDIKAYVFTKRNRLCWRNAAALYAWVNGAATYYTDHRSPLVGDVVYSDSIRTSSGYTVTSYDSSTPAITVNGTAYTRDNSQKVDAVEIYTATEVSAGTTSIYAYKKDGTSAGTASKASATTLTLSGKTYTRYSSRDFHTDNKATIVLWGNEHGPQSDPNEPSIILYRLAKDLCNGCADNSFISFLRGYCKIVVIPAANPYGVNLFASSGQEGRNNANGVNINRNYDTVGWSVQTDINKGSYAGDQPETQFIMNTVLDIEPDLAVDIHCLGYVTEANDGRCHYEGAVSLLNQKVGEVMNGYCGLSYTSYGNENPDNSATGADWIYSLRIAGGLIEMNAGPYAASFDGEQHSEIAMFADYTLLLNTIRMWYYNLDSTLDLSRMSIK